jgi:zinc-binding alcohol dehydrogenase/oxidoreductase
MGEGVIGWNKGDQVIIDPMVVCMECPECLCGHDELCRNQRIVGGRAWGGTLAEYIKVPVRNIVKKPVHLSMEQAAGLPIALGTAWRSLITKAGLKQGETILIQGIGGGVANFCLQIAVTIGAKVIVTSSSNDKIQRALSMGAAAGINYREEDVPSSVRTLTEGRGADVVVSSTGDAVSTAVQAAASQGRIVNFAYIGRPLPSFDADMLMSKHLTLMGTAMYNHREFEEAIQFVNETHFIPVISEVYPIDKYEIAFESMKSSTQFGKIVLQI